MTVRQPFYLQVADTLRMAIVAGDFEPTEKLPHRDVLPSVLDLSLDYGVSEKTAARAVQQLVAEGLVKHRPGRRSRVVFRRLSLD